MAYEQRIHTVSLPNGQGVAIPQFAFVTLDGTYGQVAPAESGAVAVGVAQEPVATTDLAASIQPLDGSISKVQVGAGAAVLIGARLTGDGSGLAITATTGNHILGIALEAGAEGQIIAAVVANLGTSA